MPPDPLALQRGPPSQIPPLTLMTASAATSSAKPGTISLRHGGRLYHIGVGRTHAGTHIILLIRDLDVRIINAATGELLRQLTLDPSRNYQPAGPRPAHPANGEAPNPDVGSRTFLCPERSQCAPNWTAFEPGPVDHDKGAACSRHHGRFDLGCNDLPMRVRPPGGHWTQVREPGALRPQPDTAPRTSSRTS